MLIARGRVTVDGTPARLGQKVDPSKATIEVDGLPLPLAPDLVHYLLNKPPGVVSTTSDPQGRRTVIDLVPGDPPVYPVGRLDTDSEGLLLLSNDGDFTLHMTHPRYGIAKRYVAMVEGAVDGRIGRQLTTGMDLDDGPAAAAAARILERGSDRSLVEVEMTEGRNRIVRRIFAALGHPVERLVRISIGGLRDDRLKPGEWRTLDILEVRSLYSAGSTEVSRR